MERSGAHNKLGAHGEKLAAEFLVGKGLVEIVRNLTFKQGEIDLLMFDGDVVVIVEVKTGMKEGMINPVFRISPAKQRKLWLLAGIVSVRYPGRNVRVDGVVVYWERGEVVITHLENILY